MLQSIYSKPENHNPCLLCSKTELFIIGWSQDDTFDFLLFFCAQFSLT